MSYQKAQDYLSQNNNLIDSIGKNNLTPKVLWNLNSALWNLTQALEEDMDRIHFLLSQIIPTYEGRKSIQPTFARLGRTNKPVKS